MSQVPDNVMELVDPQIEELPGIQPKYALISFYTQPGIDVPLLSIRGAADTREELQSLVSKLELVDKWHPMYSVETGKMFRLYQPDDPRARENLFLDKAAETEFINDIRNSQEKRKQEREKNMKRIEKNKRMADPNADPDADIDTDYWESGLKLVQQFKRFEKSFEIEAYLTKYHAEKLIKAKKDLFSKVHDELTSKL